MKNNTMRIALVLCLCVVTFALWDKDKPASSTSLRNSNPELLANQSALETAFTQDHEFSTGGTNSGEHEQIKFNAPISTPTNAANKGWVYEKDVSSVVELHWLDESGNELQMTSGGDLYSSAGLTVTTASTFNGSITLGAGDDLIGSATSDITFNTDKFTVAGATGNTVVAGTLAVTGTSTLTGIATLGDSSQMATSAAPTADADLANKKYVDDIPWGQVCRVWCDAATVMTANAWTKIAHDTDDFDPDNISDLANNRITPTKSGHYQVNAGCFVNSLTGGAVDYILAIYKNGTAVAQVYTHIPSGNADVGATVSDIVFCNGSTDYIESFFNNGHSSNAGALSGLQVNDFLSVARIDL